MPSEVLQATVGDTSNVQVKHPAGTDVFTQKPPLLALELHVSDGSAITCRTDLDSIVPRMLAIFDKAVAVTQVRAHHVVVCWSLVAMHVPSAPSLL